MEQHKNPVKIGEGNKKQGRQRTNKKLPRLTKTGIWSNSITLNTMVETHPLIDRLSDWLKPKPRSNKVFIRNPL